MKDSILESAIINYRKQTIEACNSIGPYRIAMFLREYFESTRAKYINDNDMQYETCRCIDLCNEIIK
jgi:hypothetical protein